ncbi:UNVERIFIED_CONTAM: ABC-2 type transport system ATP-binding protein [Acetivibrio alkalicellulosi]
MEKVLEIKGITKKYKNGRGIWDINLDINKGDIFGFLGPNGAGKTTAMKIMTGMMKPDTGDVKIFEHSVIEQFEKAMKKVGCIIETAESYGYLSAYENLKLHSRFYKDIGEERIDEVLEFTGILKYKKEKVKNFSLGMKQRIGIAAAILSKPELVILDEPLNGLDVEGMIEMRKLIKHLSDTEKTTFFISSHLIHDVELTCNRIGIVYNGKLVSVDYTKNILMNYPSLENYFVSEVDKNGNV